MRMREWLESKMRTTFEFASSVQLADALDPLLDAEVYGLCKTCGGTRLTPKPYGDERDRGRTFSACPDCAGKVSVVTQEAREQVISDLVPGLARVLKDTAAGLKVGSVEEVTPHIVDAVLSVVLGDVRTATEMLTVRNGNEIEMNEAVDGTPMLGVQTDTNSAYWPCPVTIAILEEEK